MSDAQKTENIETPETPETEDDGIRGELAPAEIAQLQQLQAQANSCYNQIGQLEVRKASILGRVGAIEAQGQQTMDGIASRCDIAPGTPWKVTPDNKIQVVANVVPFPGAAASAEEKTEE